MKPFLFSNSSTKDWHTCRRKFFLRYLYGGQGITSVYVEEDLLFGHYIHVGMEHLWNGETEKIAELRKELQEQLLADPIWEWALFGLPLVDGVDARRAKAEEWGRLLEGMLWAAHRVVIPYFRRGYELKWVEADAIRWVQASPQVGLMAKPDTILEGDGIQGHPGMGYLEWKTVGTADKGWHRQWVRNPQTWTGAITLDAANGIRPEWFTVVGLVKGVERKGLRSSPHCWAYWRNDAIAVRGEGYDPDVICAPDGDRWKREYTNRKGWFRRSTDTFPGGVKGWIDAQSDDELKSLFVITEPIEIEWDLAEEWLENQKDLVRAASEARKAEADGRDAPLALFPRELSQCEVGPYNKPCPFREFCHNPAVQLDPIGSGKFMWRRPHHHIEIALEAQYESTERISAMPKEIGTSVNPQTGVDSGGAASGA